MYVQEWLVTKLYIQTGAPKHLRESVLLDNVLRTQPHAIKMYTEVEVNLHAIFAFLGLCED